MGAKVVITEVNPTRALEAVMEGFHVMPLIKASEIGDIFVTATGNLHVIRKEHLQQMKNGAILANTGHFNVEISIPDLEDISTSKRRMKQDVEEYSLKDGRTLYLLAEGRLVNLAAAEGHPSEVMDMSFANQALCIEHLVKKGEMKPRVYSVPREIDELVAVLKLKAMNREIDILTEEQKRYIASWKAGTV
jgi:adenosylhomocysteinase